MSFFATAFFMTILLIALYSAILSTMIGTVVYMGRFYSTAGALSHAILGGVGLATWLGFSLWLGAVAAALVVSFIMAFVSAYNPNQLEITSNIVWGGGMSLGILFTSFAPGYQQNLSNFLFGNIILVSSSDSWAILGITLFCASILFIFYRQLFLLWFSPVFAKVQRLNVFFLWFLSILIVALGVVSLVKVMGIALVLILLSLPAHIARMFVSSLRWMLLVSFCITLSSIFLGLCLSYLFDTPAGASISLLCLGFYILSLLINRRISGFFS